MRKALFIWLLIYCSFNCFAQSDSIKIENLYEEAKKNVYKNPKQALKQIESLIKQSNANTDQLVNIYFLKSTAYSNLSDREHALESLTKTYDLVKDLKDNQTKVSVLHRIASIYQNLKLYDKSLNYLNEAEKTIAQIKNKDEKYIAISYNYTIRGLIFKDSNNCSSAMDYFNKGIESYNQIQNKFVSNSNKSVIYYNLGYCYLKTNKNDAEKAFKESYRLAKLTDTKILIAYSLKGLGEYYFKLNEYKISNEKLNEAISLLDNIEDPILKRNIYSLVGLNSIALQEWLQYEKADSLSTLYGKKVRDSENRTISLTIKSLDEEAKSVTKKSLINTIIIGIGSFLVLIFISYFFYKRYIMLNKNILKSQEELISHLNKK